MPQASLKHLTSGKTALAMRDTVQRIKKAAVSVEQSDAKPMKSFQFKDQYGDVVPCLKPAPCPCDDPCTRVRLRLDGPDAELIRICDQHIQNLVKFNNAPHDIESDDDPSYAPYLHTRDAICAAKPLTLEGMAAKGRAAKAEAAGPGGSENFENCRAGQWAWDIMHDLIRLAGGVA
jgi:hypothetical protein